MTLPRLNQKIYLLSATAFTLFTFFLSGSGVSAASIFLNPATGLIDKETSQVQITLDTEDSTQIDSLKIFLSYDPSVIDITRINNGDLSTYTIKENDPATGLITIEGYFVPNPTSNQVLEIATLDIRVLKNNSVVNIEVLTTSPYTSEVSETSGTNVLYSTIDANLTASYTSGPNTTYSSNTNVPNTGTYTTLNIALIAGGLIVLSFAVKKHAVSKF